LVRGLGPRVGLETGGAVDSFQGGRGKGGAVYFLGGKGSWRGRICSGGFVCGGNHKERKGVHLVRRIWWNWKEKQ